MAKQFKSPINVEWFNVTYRSVMVTLGILALLGALAGAGYWYFFSSSGPKQEAQDAITRAERALERADGLEGDEKLKVIRESSRAALEEAHSAFEFASYESARIAAIRSENLSRQAISLASPETEVPKLVRFVRLEGEVRVKRRGEFAWEPANRRMALNIGDQIKTSSSASAQLIYIDGTVTTIEPGSLLEIRDIYEDPATKVRRVREKLNWGELNASTHGNNAAGSYHEVATDKVSARVEEAGEFRVSYDKQDGKATFDVFEGRIEVSAPDRRENLVAGERIHSNAKGRLSAKEVLPGVPRLIAPSDQKVYVGEDPSKLELKLNWEGVPGATHYHLIIADSVLFTDPLYDGNRQETSVLIDGFDNSGDYYWRVAAITRSGVMGPFSAPRRFRVSSQVIRDRSDTTPPELQVTEFVPIGPMLVINGNTEPGARLWIDNEKIDVSQDGTFSSVIRLRNEGVNEVRLVAQDSAGNESVLTRSAYVESY